MADERPRSHADACPTLESLRGVDEASMNALRKARVTKVQHIVAWKDTELVKTASITPGALSQVYEAVHSQFAARRVRASDLPSVREEEERLNDVRHIPPFLRTQLLYYLCGVGYGDIVEIVGQSSCGKTQLSLTVSAAVLASGKSVVLLDTSSCLAVDRIQNILFENGCTQELVDACTRRIIHIPVSVVEDVLPCLRALRDDITLVKACGISGTPGNEIDSTGFAFENESMESALKNIGLILFDSPAALLSSVLGLKVDNTWSGYAFSNDVASLLRSLGDIIEGNVLTTNRVVRSDGGNHARAALGRSWVHVPMSRIFLTPTRQNNTDSQIDSLLVNRRVVSKCSGPSEIVLCRICEQGVLPCSS